MAGESVLVVDDNAINLKVIRLALEADGYSVRTAVDAEEVLDVLKVYRPHLILMDIQLPGMDGLELTRRLKADPATAGIAIVAITAYAMKGDDEKAIAAGCNGYIAKPVDTRSLSGVVAEHLRRAGPVPEGPR